MSSQPFGRAVFSVHGPLLLFATWYTEACLFICHTLQKEGTSGVDWQDSKIHTCQSTSLADDNTDKICEVREGSHLLLPCTEIFAVICRLRQPCVLRWHHTCINVSSCYSQLAVGRVTCQNIYSSSWVYLKIYLAHLCVADLFRLFFFFARNLDKRLRNRKTKRRDE